MRYAILPAAARQCLKAPRPAPDTPFSRRVLRARGVEAEGAVDEAGNPRAALSDLRPALAGILQSHRSR
jgi:hypothetical protein